MAGCRRIDATVEYPIVALLADDNDVLVAGMSLGTEHRQWKLFDHSEKRHRSITSIPAIKIVTEHRVIRAPVACHRA